jgi:hypothetical protein
LLLEVLGPRFRKGCSAASEYWESRVDRGSGRGRGGGLDFLPDSEFGGRGGSGELQGGDNGRRERGAGYQAG